MCASRFFRVLPASAVKGLFDVKHSEGIYRFKIQVNEKGSFLTPRNRLKVCFPVCFPFREAHLGVNYRLAYFTSEQPLRAVPGKFWMC